MDTLRRLVAPALRRFAPDLLVALGLLILPLILFGPVVFGSRTLLPADNLLAIEPWRSAREQFDAPTLPHNSLLSDLVLENYPWKKFIVDSLQAGELPLWNPYQFAGVPFLAAGQHSALYPFSVVFYLVPLPRAYGLFTVSQFFLAGALAYLFLRVLGLRRPAAALGAVVYELCLFMVVSVVFPMIVAGAAWLPLILTAIELIIRQQPALGRRPATIPWLILGAGALGCQVLAGHVEITYYTLLVAGAFSLWRLITSAWGNARRFLGRATALLGLAGFGLALSAVQLIPLYELVSLNFRSGSATFDQIMDWSYPWRRAIAFLVPNFFGSPTHHGYFDLFTGQWTTALTNLSGHVINTIDWGRKNYVEGGAYVGILPLLLALLAVYQLSAHYLRAARRPATVPATIPEPPALPAPSTLLFFVVLALAALAFIFPTRLYALIFWLPGVDQLHSPFRWVWPLGMCVAFLSAYGLHTLLASADAPRRSPAKVLGISALVVGLLGLLALLVAWLGFDQLGLEPILDQLVRDLALAEFAFSGGRMFFAYEARWLAQAALLLAASGLVLLAAAHRLTWRGRPIWPFLAVGLVAVDLLGAGWDFNPAADPAILSYTPPSVRSLRQDTSLWRFTTYDTADCDQSVTPPQPCKPFNANAGWYWNLHDIRGYDSIFTQQYRRYMELIEPQYELEFNRIAPLSEPSALDSPLLDLLNVKYVLTQETIDNPRFALVYEGEVRIYRNDSALPRAFTLPLSQAVTVPDFAAAVQTLDPRQYVILESPGAELPPSVPAPRWPDPVEDISYSPDEVIVTATVAEPAWLILADSYFPGWRAYGRPTGADESQEQPLTIALVNGNFRGVQLPAGSWTVRFNYSPDSVKFGGIISFTAGVSLLFLLGIYAWRYFYRESAVDSTARRVAKNSLAPIVLNLGNRVIDLAFAAFYLRVLGPGDAGKYYFAIVVFGWFEIVSNYGLDTLLMRDVARDRAHASRYLLNTTLLRMGLGVVAVIGLALVLVLRQTLPSFDLPFGLGAFHPDRLSADTIWAIALLVIAQLPATVAAGLAGLFRAFEKAEYPAAIATVATLVKVTVGAIALVLGFGFVGLAGASIFVNLVTLGLLGALAWRMFAEVRQRARPDVAFQRHALSESFPLMLNNLLATLFFKVDVPILESIRGPREVGWYSTGYKYVEAFNVVPSLFTLALFPVMSRQAAGDPAALRRSYTLGVKLLVSLALPLAVVTAALAPTLVGLLGGAEYLPQGAIALAVLVWSIPFGWINSLTNYVLIALGRQRALTRAFALALTFNVVLNLLLVPSFGFAAAAALTIASEFFEGLLFYVSLRRSLGGLPWVRILGPLWVSLAAMGAVTHGLWFLNPLLALGAGAVVYCAGVVVLRAFSAEERALLADVLPKRLRRALRLASSAP